MPGWYGVARTRAAALLVIRVGQSLFRTVVKATTDKRMNVVFQIPLRCEFWR